MQNDLVLLAHARKLDMDALAQIHDVYYPPIFRYIAGRVRDRAVAEDLTSDVFMHFLTAVHDQRGPNATLGGWLYRVAANVVRDHYRKHYRAPHVALDATMTSPEIGPEALAETALAGMELRRAVAGLTEDQQHVIALRFGDELPIQAVARIMGKTESAIKQLQARAIAALARTLAPGSVG